MADSLEALNLNFGGRPVRRPRPTRTEVASLEERVDSSLPESYVRLLMLSNGGHPELDSFVPVGAEANDRWSVDVFYPAGSSADSSESVLGVTESWSKVLGPNSLVVARDGGGNQIFLDFTVSPPTVNLCVHDADFKVRYVAPTFDRFVELLETNPDYI